MKLSDQIRSAGIVGCGGAGFPTHVKYAAPAEMILINGAECEPLLRTDRYLMRHRAGDIVFAAGALLRETGARECVIALKESYREETAALREAIAEQKSPVGLHLMNSFFPAGDEQTVVREVTGRVVPPGGLPGAVGCVVSNAATVLCIANALRGRPFTQKYLTVTGEVGEPIIVKAPVGTPLAACLALAGGPAAEDYVVIDGGPMMGRVLDRETFAASCVTKTTSALLVLPADHPLAARKTLSPAAIQNRARSCCIQCSFCTDLCPRALLGHPLSPSRIMRRVAQGGDIAGMLDDPRMQAASLCCGCGVCEVFACPMGLQPRQVIAQVKDALAQAGLRPQFEDQGGAPSPMREDRRVPTARLAARAGLSKYQDLRIDTLKKAEPAVVRPALRQSIGAAAEPVVSPGDAVTHGDRIAACPEGKLGVDLHAPICGTVTAVTAAYIEITGKGGRCG